MKETLERIWRDKWVRSPGHKVMWHGEKGLGGKTENSEPLLMYRNGKKYAGTRRLTKRS